MIRYAVTRAIYLLEAEMPELELSAGSIDYEDTGGNGPVLVLLGGLVMDGSVWDPMVEELRGAHRCIVPTLPLGAHRRPMKADADLSLTGFAHMISELLERLDLHDVTIVQNDHAAALVLASEDPPRIARLVISSCEAFENYPPGLPGKNIRLTGWVPGGLFISMHTLRVRALRRLPIAFGWMSKRPLPDELLDRWLEPLQTQRAIRRDLRRYVTGARRRQMIEVCARLGRCRLPTLIVWTPEDRVQRPEHGRRLADAIPGARLVEIADSYTLIMRDQPQAFARAVSEFVRESTPHPAAARTEAVAIE
jgi:pimeloyl-ACP methyl ester carboxylesterase